MHSFQLWFVCVKLSPPEEIATAITSRFLCIRGGPIRALDRTIASMHLRPSQLASFVSFDCDKWTWKSVHASEDAKKLIPTKTAEAHFRRGLEYEDALTDTLDNVYDASDDPANSYDLWFRQPGGTIIAQPRFTVPVNFYTEEMRDAGITFSSFIPDFIELRQSPGGTRRKLYIMDAKASQKTRLSHQVQVTFYALFLEAIIEEEHRMDVEVDPHGGIWRPELKQPDTFPLALLRPLVQRFLYYDLPRLAMVPLQDVNWFVRPKCRGCPHLADCRSSAPTESPLSLIPGLSDPEHRMLAKVLHSCERTDDVLDDLENIANPYSHPDRNPRQQRHLQHLLQVRQAKEPKTIYSPLLESHRRKSPIHKGRPTLTFPAHQDLTLTLSLCMDPLDRTVLAWSVIMRSAERNIVRKGFSRVRFSANAHADVRSPDVNTTEEKLVTTIYQCFRTAEGMRLADGKIPSLCVFVWDEGERADLQDCLLRTIARHQIKQHQDVGPGCDDEESLLSALASLDIDASPSTSMLEMAMCCLLNLVEDATYLTEQGLQVPNLGAGGWENTYPISFPRTVLLQKTLQTMVALPVVGFCTYSDAVRHLLEKQNREESRTEVYDIWASGATTEVVTASLDERAKDMSAMVQKLGEMARAEAQKQKIPLENLLPGAPGSFRMANPIPMRNAILQQLAFYKQYESVSGSAAKASGSH